MKNGDHGEPFFNRIYCHYTRSWRWTTPFHVLSCILVERWSKLSRIYRLRRETVCKSTHKNDFGAGYTFNVLTNFIDIKMMLLSFFHISYSGIRMSLTSYAFFCFDIRLQLCKNWCSVAIACSWIQNLQFVLLFDVTTIWRRNRITYHLNVCIYSCIGFFVALVYETRSRDNKLKLVSFLWLWGREG